MWDFCKPKDIDADARYEQRLTDPQLRNMEAGRGCVACGLDSVEIRHEMQCCGDRPCQRHIDVVYETRLQAKRRRALTRQNGRKTV